MKKLFILLLLCFLPSVAQETEELEMYEPHQHSIGSLMVGWTRYFNVVDSYAKPSGVLLGLLVPVNLPGVDTHIKIKGTFFNVEGDEFSGMASLVNELLVGKIAYKEDYLFVLPQLGLGARSESLFHRFDEGYFNVKLFIDASLWIDYHLETFSAGFMFNFEHDLPSQDVGFISDNRFSVSFVLTK